METLKSKLEIRHGTNCVKAPHDNAFHLYAHHAEDDTIYDKCGKIYCGRCHVDVQCYGATNND